MLIVLQGGERCTISTKKYYIKHLNGPYHAETGHVRYQFTVYNSLAILSHLLLSLMPQDIHWGKNVLGPLTMA